MSLKEIAVRALENKLWHSGALPKIIPSHPSPYFCFNAWQKWEWSKPMPPLSLCFGGSKRWHHLVPRSPFLIMEIRLGKPNSLILSYLFKPLSPIYELTHAILEPWQLSYFQKVYCSGLVEEVKSIIKAPQNKSAMPFILICNLFAWTASFMQTSCLHTGVLDVQTCWGCFFQNYLFF